MWYSDNVTLFLGIDVAMTAYLLSFLAFHPAYGYAVFVPPLFTHQPQQRVLSGRGLCQNGQELITLRRGSYLHSQKGGDDLLNCCC
uniref:Uncharacterized protein n=1 Tax=Anopheles darlingi TaxID=43151 RepID=A0A2M4DG56_ANODA